MYRFVISFVFVLLGFFITPCGSNDNISNLLNTSPMIKLAQDSIKVGEQVVEGVADVAKVSMMGRLLETIRGMMVQFFIGFILLILAIMALIYVLRLRRGRTQEGGEREHEGSEGDEGK